MATDKGLRPGRWLKREDFGRVGRGDIRDAVRVLASGRSAAPFGKSTDYDVVVADGPRLPPKAVFGLAARAALSMDVRPKHFRGGAGTPCFRAIAAAGFGIEPKREGGEDSSRSGRRVGRRQTPAGQPPALRAQPAGWRWRRNVRTAENTVIWRARNASGFPAGEYEACIEVHHKIPLGELGKRRKTRLEDLMCVCANCHRVLHHRLRAAEDGQHGGGRRHGREGGEDVKKKPQKGNPHGTDGEAALLPAPVHRALRERGRASSACG